MPRLFPCMMLASTLLAGVAGCGPAVAVVTGEVQVDGKPMAKGVITVTPAQGPPTTANVVEGRYEVRTTPGEQRVMFSMPVVVSTRKDSKSPNATLIEITE